MQRTIDVVIWFLALLNRGTINDRLFKLHILVARLQTSEHERVISRILRPKPPRSHVLSKREVRGTLWSSSVVFRFSAVFCGSRERPAGRGAAAAFTAQETSGSVRNLLSRANSTERLILIRLDRQRRPSCFCLQI